MRAESIAAIEGAPRSSLSCVDLTVGYPNATVLTGVDVEVRPGEIVALLGPSGSGKSTLLHTIAGFVPSLGGEIRIAGRVVATGRRSVAPEARDIGMVFQNYALWPHMSVLDTVAYPLRRKGTPASRARAEALALLDRLQIAHLAERRPVALSGGEQQRVGLARALARDAALYLFDEPTAHLDSHLRSAFQLEVAVRQRATGAAALYATHDAAEALGIADRLAILGGGGLVQVGSPAEVYARPTSEWAARLTGPASVLSATITSIDQDTVGVLINGAEIRLPSDTLDSTGPSGGRRRVLLRPEWTSAGGPLSGRLRAVAFRGPHTDYLVEIGPDAVLVRRPGVPRHRVGESFRWGIDRAWLLPDGTADAAETAGTPIDWASSGNPVNPVPAPRRGARPGR